MPANTATSHKRHSDTRQSWDPAHSTRPAVVNAVHGTVHGGQSSLLRSSSLHAGGISQQIALFAPSHTPLLCYPGVDLQMRQTSRVCVDAECRSGSPGKLGYGTSLIYVRITHVAQIRCLAILVAFMVS